MHLIESLPLSLRPTSRQPPTWPVKATILSVPRVTQPVLNTDYTIQFNMNPQDLFDSTLSTIETVADSIDRHMDAVYHSIRLTLQTSPWIPDSIKPPPPPPPKVIPSIPQGYLGTAKVWVNNNRAVSAAVVAFFGTGAFILWRQRRSYRQKRRARKGANGAKTEVVVLVGSPHSRMVKAIAADLERRGFVVYITVGSLAEEKIIRAEAKPDIHPLNIDMSSDDSIQAAIDKFSDELCGHKSARSSRLASVILVPSELSTNPVPNTMLHPASAWGETLNSQMLPTIVLAQSFVPYLAQRRSSPGLDIPASLVLLTTTITPSIPDPSHHPEAVTTAALTTYLHCLRKEDHRSLYISHLRLGSFNFGLSPELAQQLVVRSRAGSPASGISSDSSETTERAKGSPPRVLHNAVFDAVTCRTTGTVFVGSGARTYGLVGDWLPDGLAWRIISQGVAKHGKASESSSRRISEEWERVEGEGVEMA